MNWKNIEEFEQKAKEWCNEYACGVSVIGEGDVLDHGDTLIVYFETQDTRNNGFALIDMKVIATMDEDSWNVSAEGRFESHEEYQFLDYV